MPVPITKLSSVTYTKSGPLNAEMLMLVIDVVDATLPKKSVAEVEL